MSSSLVTTTGSRHVFHYFLSSCDLKTKKTSIREIIIFGNFAKIIPCALNDPFTFVIHNFRLFFYLQSSIYPFCLALWAS